MWANLVNKGTEVIRDHQVHQDQMASLELPGRLEQLGHKDKEESLGRQDQLVKLVIVGILVQQVK